MLKPVVNLSINGFDRAAEEFEAMGLSIKAILRQAARKAGSLLSKDARSRVEPAKNKTYSYGKRVYRYRTTGLLRKSMSFRVHTSRRTGTVFGLIGAKREVEGTLSRGPGREPQKIKPFKYLHLIEKGFMLKAWKSNKRRFIEGKSILDRSYQDKGQEVQELTKSTVKTGLQSAKDKRKALLESL